MTALQVLQVLPPAPSQRSSAEASRQAPAPAIRSLRVAHRRGGRLAAPLRNYASLTAGAGAWRRRCAKI